MDAVHTIGWQGITVTVPAHWRLAQTRGTARNGYFRVDDEHHPRLEVRWSHPKRDVALAVTSKRFLSSLRRRARREGKRIQFSESPRPFTSGAIPRNKEVLSFSWSTNVHAWGTIWKCRDCGRLVAAQVMFHGKDKNFSLVRQVLSSLEDHAGPEGILWSAHGFQFRLPAELKLRQWQSKPASSRAEFRAQLRTRLIVAWHDGGQSGDDPASLARLARKTLKRRGRRPFEWFRIERILSHDGIAFAETGPIRPYRTRRRSVRRRFYGVAFYCEWTGRQYVVMANDRRREFVGRVLSGLMCH